MHNHTIVTVLADGSMYVWKRTSTAADVEQYTAAHIKERKRDTDRAKLIIEHYVVLFEREVHVLIQD